MPHISVSEAKTARSCLKLHDYKYRQRLAPKRQASPLLMGNIIHGMLDAHAGGFLKTGGPSPEAVLAEYAKKFAKLFIEEREEYGDIIGDAQKIYDGYWRHYAEQPLEVLGSEEFIETDLGSGITFIGYIDKRYREKKTGLTWLTDHKVKKKIPEADERWSDFQLVSYVWAWNRERPKDRVDGVMWDYIRRKAPRIPEQLKSGELTQRKDIDTDLFTYLQEIRRLGLSIKEYKKIIDILRAKPNTFYHREKLPSPPKVAVDQIIQDLKTDAVKIHRLGTKGITRNMSYDCGRCDFFKLCQAELRGLDAAFIRKTEYVEKEISRHGRQEVDQETP